MWQCANEWSHCKFTDHVGPPKGFHGNGLVDNLLSLRVCGRGGERCRWGVRRRRVHVAPCCLVKNVYIRAHFAGTSALSLRSSAPATTALSPANFEGFSFS